jgi:hypothetical protein
LILDNDSQAGQPIAQTDTEEQARYDGKPLMIIIENYILDTIGKLHPAQLKTTEKIVRSTFGGDKDWRPTLREALGLSAELDNELINMWENNQKIAEQEGSELTPVFFARMIVDDNFTDLIKS